VSHSAAGPQPRFAVEHSWALRFPGLRFAWAKKILPNFTRCAKRAAVKTALIFQAIVLFAATAGAAHWPTWRGGVEGSVVTEEKNVPLEWSATKNVRRSVVRRLGLRPQPRSNDSTD